MSNHTTVAIIVAGGRGTRLAQDDANSDSPHDLPKQYLMLGDKCVLQRTIDTFVDHRGVDHVQVVIHKDDFKLYELLISHHQKLLPPVSGGITRQQSVLRGLEAIASTDQDIKVLIHDAARPFVGKETVTQILEQISTGQGAIPAHPTTNTLKLIDLEHHVQSTISRDQIYCAQTPQGFMLEAILKIHQEAADSGNTDFTDDASMFEAAGLSVKIVPSPSSNFKITSNEDLTMARMIIASKCEDTTSHVDIRTGNGYDVHAFEKGDGVVLCGLEIPHDKKLKGHSDADVALHALTDALFGTIGAGDIGTHFPPSDNKWKNAQSHIFLNKALEMIEENGGRITNVDITIVCEEPKIGPHRIAMQNHLATLCAMETTRVSIKATTNEKLGFLGRGEGIAALATATVSYGVMN